MNRMLPVVLTGLFTTPAVAHVSVQPYGPVAAGFSHPLFGLDHVIAMVVVGLWACQLGARGLWAVPVAFVSSMSIGFGLAVAGLPLPAVEPMVLASIIVLGLVVTTAVRLDLRFCIALSALFAVFHGHAHGGELGDASAIRFGFGFVVATALLHAGGIGLNRLAVRTGTHGASLTRGVGGIAAAAGAALAFA